MVASLAEVEDRERAGRLAGRGQDRRDATLESGDFLCHLVVGGIRKARVEVACGLQVEEVGHLLRRLVLERG